MKQFYLLDDLSLLYFLSFFPENIREYFPYIIQFNDVVRSELQENEIGKKYE